MLPSSALPVGSTTGAPMQSPAPAMMGPSTNANPNQAPALGAVPQRFGLMRVVSNADMMKNEANDAATKAAAEKKPDPVESMLAAHVRTRMSEMRNFRNTSGIGERMIEALRTYKGKYSQNKLQQIRQFQGSEVYARITATKCRGATALLRDIYLGAERPWDIDPTPVPEIPNSIDEAIQQLVSIEATTMMQAGQQIDQQAIQDRVYQLRTQAEMAAKAQAQKEADRATSKIEDVLVEGQFYQAFAEFLIDLPIFPFACVKGPVVRRAPSLKWQDGKPVMTQIPKMFWYRVSPFDLYWSPGAADVMEAEFIERIRLSRDELLSLRGLPGYNNDAIDQVLERFSDRGFRDWFDAIDQERARMEDRENWPTTSGQLLDTAEYTGSAQGSTLIDWGMTEEDIPDPLAEYKITCWMIDRFVIKTQLNPSPRQRPNYYISNFEKTPGSMIGDGLPDILEDVQTVTNATMRALVNNLSISSGPQVVINDAVLQPGTDDNLYPWKRWHMNWDPMVTGTSKPIDFFQPQSNATELLGVYGQLNTMADEISSLPRYMTGSDKVGGAGRTASGLAMLMGNAAKTLQNVAASIDRDVFKPMLDELYDMIMLTEPGVFRGDENINVKGVTYATKREQDRMRQLEFLQITANPIDMGIIGPRGRANVLRSVSSNLGLEHEKVIPDDEEIQQQIAAQQALAQQQPPGGDPNAPPGQPGQPGMNAGPNGNQPTPQPQRAGPEQARRAIEGDQNNRATGSVGMRH